ncbi:MAG: hypothetical protein ACKVOR_01890 [Flavobacteriales bacterium]
MNDFNTPIARILCVFFFCFLTLEHNAQVITKEDSLNAGLVVRNSTTVMSGYGEALVSYDMKLRTGVADLRRNVLFFGHKFNDKVSFFSEMELEHAKVELGDDGEGAAGELSMEQLFVKFNLNKTNYITAGLFIPRIGIINENHLPTTYSSNDRPFVEQLIIPSTWRELGISLYGTSRRVSGLNYSVALMNGLSSSGFTSGTGLREGRGGGSRSSASNLAATGALLFYTGNWRLQTSAYIGGSAGLSKREADSLQLSYGAFGTPVALMELNMQRLTPVWSIKALAAAVHVADAFEINRAYGSNTAETMVGAYVEIGFNLMKLCNREQEKNFLLYARYEWMDMDLVLAEKNGVTNGIANDILNKQYVVAGLLYQPVRGVGVKADYVYRITGEPNPLLLATPFPQQSLYFTENGFFNLGICYSF